MDINITMLDGTSHMLSVNPGDTVGSLKTRIQDQLGVPPHRQRLVFVNGQNRPLNDDTKPVSFYGLQSGSQVSLLVTPTPATFQVFLRNDKGKKNTYDIKPDETVSDFKAKVQHREGVPVSQQRLIHQIRDMEGGRLADYGVKEHSTIDMLLRLRGG